MLKVIVFKFFMGEFTVRYGYKKPGFPMIYTCERDAKESEIKEYPNRINVGKRGEIHNNFIWYEWNGTNEDEELCKLEALKIFKARENMLLHKAEKEIDTRIEHERFLDSLINNLIPTYPCDPKKNIDCRKTGCFMNGGECYRTTDKSYQMLTKEAAERM